MNFDRWLSAPVWKSKGGCEAYLPKAFIGTLGNPVIGEAGRQFLADLLVQLSDSQIHDMFEVARFNLRSHDPDQDPSGRPAGIEDWVKVFKQKRDDIVKRHCS